MPTTSVPPDAISRLPPQYSRDDSGAVIGVVVAKVDTVRIYQRTGHIVDDIGVAIANRTVFAFLRSNKIDFMPALPGEGLAPGQLLHKAHAFVRQIGCWQ